MQRINQLVTENLHQSFSTNNAKTQPSTLKMTPKPQQEKSSSSEEQYDYDKRIDTLFTRFGAIYGHMWANNFQTVQSLKTFRQEWSEALSRFDNSTLKEVLVECRESKRYPPTLPEFIASCKDKVARRIPAKPREAQRQINISEVAISHLKQMKEALLR